MSRPGSQKPIPITREILRNWRLPSPGSDGDKDQRGRVLVIAGAEGMPGAAILSATAALRSGAGKLQIAAARCIAPWIAVSIPEAQVIALAEKKGGIVDCSCAKDLKEPLAKSDVLVLGPGMSDGKAISKLLQRIWPELKGLTLVIDAEALKCLDESRSGILPIDRDRKGKIVITPHAGEMADILKITKRKVEADPQRIAEDFSSKTGIITVLKGPETFICSPHGKTYVSCIGPRSAE